MREFFAWLFSQNNSELSIGLFDIWHFTYLFVTFGGTLLLSLLFRKKSEKAKDNVIKVMAYLTVGLYVADFFIMPLSDSYSGISTYKLPFNICTIMAVMVPFVQFNDRLKAIKTPVVALSITSTLMWMCYPGTALGGQPPFCYIIFQTFMYHAFLFCWGVLNLSLGKVRLEFKKIWKELCGILVILVWAAFGNAIYPGTQNWFFIQESIFPFLSDEIMPPVVIFCVFGSCFVVYCAYYAIRAIAKKASKKSTPAPVDTEEQEVVLTK